MALFQKWKLLRQGNGSYLIQVAGGTIAGKKYLSSTSDGSTVDLYHSNENSGLQEWVLTMYEPTARPSAQPSSIPSEFPTRPTFNVAIFGTASQSCTSEWDNGAHTAIDGNTDGYLNNGSVTHTCFMLEAWWKVDLAFETEINKIIVWNRVDGCCPYRLSNSDVVILDNNNNEIVSRYIGDTTGVEKITFEFTDGTFGSTVMVKLRGTEFLSLAEVEVLSYSDSAQPSASPHR